MTSAVTARLVTLQAWTRAVSGDHVSGRPVLPGKVGARPYRYHCPRRHLHRRQRRLVAKPDFVRHDAGGLAARRVLVTGRTVIMGDHYMVQGYCNARIRLWHPPCTAPYDLIDVWQSLCVAVLGT